MRNDILKFIIALLIIIPGLTRAQFNPEEVRKSLVKVMVKEGNQASVCTGFIWKRGDWIVTSLHAMKPNGSIRVAYLENIWRNARMVKAYKEADLVLLQVEGDIPAGIRPLIQYEDRKIPYGTEIHTMGYNSGAKGSSSRTLKKGYVNPETLEYLIPEADRRDIAQAGFPDLSLEIIYLDGSLLPGYSGSPVMDQTGKLVGIGNGGLEGGASNVSWVIPARFLVDLEGSSLSTLPPGFEKVKQTFSANLTVEVQSDDISAIEDKFEEEYVSYAYGDFDFYWTKSRSFSEMYYSAYDPDNMLMFMSEFVDYNLSIDYEVLRYDIYEDINNGIVIAVPEFQDIYYNDADELFEVDLSDYSAGEYFGLVYGGIKDDFRGVQATTVVDEIVQEIDLALGAAVGGFKVDEDYSYNIQIDENNSISWLMMGGNQAIVDDFGTMTTMVLYMTIIIGEKQAFYSIASIIGPVQMLNEAMTTGIDCINYYEYYPEYCDYFESLMHVMGAAHLTTMANKQVVRADR